MWKNKEITVQNIITRDFQEQLTHQFQKNMRLKLYTFSYDSCGLTTAILLLPVPLTHLHIVSIYIQCFQQVRTFKATSLWVARVTLLTITDWIVVWNPAFSIWPTVTRVHTQSIDTRLLKGTLGIGCATNIWGWSYRKYEHKINNISTSQKTFFMLHWFEKASSVKKVRKLGNFKFWYYKA